MNSWTLSDRDVVVERDQSELASSVVVSLASRRNNSSWERDIVDTLCRYLELAPGWDGYGGKPLRHDTGMFALQVLRGVMGDAIPMPSIVPVSSGGVQVEWHQNGIDIELYIAGPYDCELSVYDHTTGAAPETISLKADLSPLMPYIRRLVDYNRHLQRANAG